MRLTRFGFHGLVFYLVMLGAFYASPYSNLFFLLLGFLTILGAAGVWSGWRNLRGVAASLADLEPVPSGATVEVPLELRAPDPARFQVAAHLELAGGQVLEGRADLVAGRASITLRAAGLARGAHAVEHAVLESTHPLGFVRALRAFEAPRELLVYPAPRGELDGRSAHGLLDELLGRGEPGAGDLQPSGLRDHRAGEGPRGIHWRASARRGRLVVQEWEGGLGQGLEVVLDRRCAPAELEEALATVSALVHVARESKETLRLHSQDLAATYGEGHRPWAEALRFLACAEALPADGPPPPPTSPGVARLPRAAVPAEGRARV